MGESSSLGQALFPSSLILTLIFVVRCLPYKTPSDSERLGTFFAKFSIPSFSPFLPFSLLSDYTSPSDPHLRDREKVDPSPLPGRPRKSPFHLPGRPHFNFKSPCLRPNQSLYPAKVRDIEELYLDEYIFNESTIQMIPLGESTNVHCVAWHNIIS